MNGPAQGHMIDRCRDRTRVQAVWLSSELCGCDRCIVPRDTFRLGMRCDTEKNLVRLETHTQKMQAVSLGILKEMAPCFGAMF